MFAGNAGKVQQNLGGGFFLVLTYCSTDQYTVQLPTGL